jgi:hypothetical protein
MDAAQAQRLGFTPYAPDQAQERVPLTEWGKDHWSTFAYLETVAVDARGTIENVRMRCDSRLHRPFAHGNGLGHLHDGGKFPTRLKGSVERAGHDDWSCVEDMVVEGLIQAWWRADPALSIGGATCLVALTERGWRCAAALRAHKAAGGRYADFTWNE